MKKIILIDSIWDIRSPALQYALTAAKGTDTEIAGIFLTSDSTSKTFEDAEATLEAIKQEFAAGGITFSSYVTGPEPGAFIRRIDDLMPASLVLIGEANFTGEMKKGGASIEALKEKLTCPVTTAGNLAGAQAGKKAAKGINWGKFIMYAIGSIFMYGIFYPKIVTLNGSLFMKGTVLGGLAIMAVVIVHAWVWGNTTYILPKIFKLED